MGFVCTTLTCSRGKLFLSLSCSCESPEGGLECLWRNLSYLLLKMEQINLRKMPGLACKVGRSAEEDGKAGRLYQPCACQLCSPFRAALPGKGARELVQLSGRQGKHRGGRGTQSSCWTDCVWLGWVCLGKSKVPAQCFLPLPSLF